MEDLFVFGIMVGFGLLMAFRLYKYSGKKSTKDPDSREPYNNTIDTFWGDDGGVDFFD